MHVRACALWMKSEKRKKKNLEVRETAEMAEVGEMAAPMHRAWLSLAVACSGVAGSYPNPKSTNNPNPQLTPFSHSGRKSLGLRDTEQRTYYPTDQLGQLHLQREDDKGLPLQGRSPCAHAGSLSFSPVTEPSPSRRSTACSPKKTLRQ